MNHNNNLYKKTIPVKNEYKLIKKKPFTPEKWAI